MSKQCYPCYHPMAMIPIFIPWVNICKSLETLLRISAHAGPLFLQECHGPKRVKFACRKCGRLSIFRKVEISYITIHHSSTNVTSKRIRYWP